MSDRPRRREASWDKKQEMLSPSEIHSNVSWGSSPKWSKSEVNDGMMSGKFSGKHAREPMLEKRSGPMNDDFSRNRRRMETDPGFDGWEKQYSTHQSVDSYGPPYRGHDSRKGGNALVSRDRYRDQDRPRSPYRSRSRSRGLARVSTRSRSRSRSRGRDWGGTKARSGTGSPFNDDRHETNEYDVDARSWSRRQDHTGGSRYGDYRRDDRNQFDDHNHRRQSNRTSRIPCRYFAAGNCNRDDCKFSHDIPETRRYDGRSHEDIREHNSGNRNKTWHEQKPPDDFNRSDFNAKSSFGANKSWDDPLWDDVEPRGINERSRKDTHKTTLHDKNRTWDEVDASGQPDVVKSNRNSDKKKTWDGPSWDEVTGWGFSNASKPCHNPEEHKKSWNGVDESSLDDIHDHTSHDNNRIRNDKDASGFPDVENSSRMSDNKKKSWNGPSWDEADRIWDDVEPRGFNKRLHNDIHERTSNAKNSLWDKADASGFPDAVKTNPNPDNNKLWNGSELNENGSEKNENLLPQWMNAGNDSNKSNANIVSDDANQQVSYEKDSIQSVNDMNSQSLSCLDETKNPLNKPKVQLNEHVEGMNLNQQTQIQSKECGESLKPIDVDVPHVMSDANEANLSSQLAPQVNNLPVSLPELSQIEVQVPELYRDLNITDAIDYLQSLASSVHNQDTQHNSTTSMEVKTNIKTDKIVTAVEKEPIGNLEEADNTAAENAKQEQHNIKPEKVEEGNDEKAMRLFKVALVEFVKEILKPKWKEGKLSREVHKNVVKKVVDKVTDAIQVNQIPRTQVKIEQYLAYSKPKITKLVEAYVERFLKA